MNESHMFSAPQTPPLESGKLHIPEHLAEHLERYGEIAKQARTDLTPVMHAILHAMNCTDKAALRAAELQKNAQ